jgi:hypothetical protein
MTTDEKKQADASRVKPSKLWVGATDDVVLAGVAKLEAAKATNVDEYIAVATKMLTTAGFVFWKPTKNGGTYHTIPGLVTSNKGSAKLERKRLYTDELDQLLFDYYGILSTFDEREVKGEMLSPSAKKKIAKLISEGERKTMIQIEKVKDEDAKKHGYKRQRSTLGPKTDPYSDDDSDDKDDADVEDADSDEEFADYQCSWGCSAQFE